MNTKRVVIDAGAVRVVGTGTLARNMRPDRQSRRRRVYVRNKRKNETRRMGDPVLNGTCSVRGARWSRDRFSTGTQLRGKRKNEKRGGVERNPRAWWLPPKHFRADRGAGLLGCPPAPDRARRSLLRARRARGRPGRRAAAGQTQMTAGSRDLGPRWAALSAAGSSRRTPAPGRSQSKQSPRSPSGLRLRCGDSCRDFALMRSCVSPVGAPAPLWFRAPGRLVGPPNLLPCYTLSIRLAPIEHVTVASSTLTISRATHCGRAPKVLAAPCATGAAGPEVSLA